MIRRCFFCVIMICTMLTIFGCQNRCEIITEENKTISIENQQLKNENSKLTLENQQLQKQITNLQGISPEARVANIITVENIELAKRTGLYDKDYNNVKEKLIVYLKTVDEYGDSIKGAGSVDIELWNLTLPAELAKLASWHITPEQLKKEWTGTMMTSYYRLVFDVADVLKPYDTGLLTVKVRFVSYLTGKDFEKQIAIER